MRQAPDHRVTANALAPAASTPPVLTSNTARQHCVVGPNALTHHLQPQAIQARESTQIRAIKDSIGHVEVFQMDGVETPIIERPRPLPGHDTPNPAHNTYTLKSKELLFRARPASSCTRCRTFPAPATTSGRGMSLPVCQVHDAGELTRATAASVLVVPHASDRH